MKRLATVGHVALAIGAAFLAPQASLAEPEPFAAANRPEAARQPNVVLIVADDQGFGDVGFNGNTQIDTPVLDALSRRGVILDQFHVSPVCSPSRASLLTGRDSLRTGVWSVTRGGETMRSSEVTLAEAFATSGYATAAFGKWHNGAHFPSNPNGQGFQAFDGFVQGHSNYWDARLQLNEVPYVSKGYLPGHIADDAVDYIKKTERPFFLYLPFNAPHSPFEPPPALFDKYKRRGLSSSAASVYALVEDLDHQVGRVLNALKQSGKERDTIVIYLSDNGPVFPNGERRYNAGLKGAKGSVDEGGTRVPFVAYWPGHVEGGRRISLPTQHIDLYPTLIALAGLRRPVGPPVDGCSLARVLTDGVIAPRLRHRRLFTNHFRNTRSPVEQAIRPEPGAVREGEWLATLGVDRRWSLYDVAHDPSQSVDLARAQPARLANLRAAYVAWYKEASRGAGTVQAVQLGLVGHDRVELQAHEASLYGRGIAYNGGAGWAHDWVSHWTSDAAWMAWPVHVNRPGTYRVTIDYATPDARTASRLKATVGRVSTSALLPAAPPSAADWGRRTVQTDEAPERVWASGTLGTLKLTPTTDWLSLHAIDVPPAGVGEVKSLRVQRIGE